MTNWLLRTFIKNSGHPEDPKVRAAVGILSGIVGIFCNILLFGGKLAVGLLTRSVSITADAMNNLSDATSSVVTMLGFRLAERPADNDHPYGHARYEYLSGLAVSALILIIGVELAKSSLDKVLHPADVIINWVTAAVLIGSILVKLWMSLFNTKLGKTIHSATLAATAADSRNDVITTSAVLLAALIEHFTAFRADGWMGLAVSCFILYSGVGLAKDTISPLLGENADPELREKIVDNIRACPKVLGFHDLMVHDYGPGQRFASIHVEMDRREDPMECHEIIDGHPLRPHRHRRPGTGPDARPGRAAAAYIRHPPGGPRFPHGPRQGTRQSDFRCGPAHRPAGPGGGYHRRPGKSSESELRRDLLPRDHL